MTQIRPPRGLGFFGYGRRQCATLLIWAMRSEPTRSEVDILPGSTVLEFRAGWCPICRAARPLIDRTLAQHPDVRHISIEDGKGKPLGRSFGVKLWPTLIFLREGREIARVVRPSGEDELNRALQALDSMAPRTAG